MPDQPASRKTFRYHFPTNPIASPGATVSGDVVGEHGSKYRFTVLDKRVIRYEYAVRGVFEDRASTFAINRQFAVPKFRVVDTPHNLEIITEGIHLQYDKKGFSASGLTADITGKFSLHGATWRYGEKVSNLGGTARTLDEANGRIPLEGGVISEAGYATIDDSKSMVFDRDCWLTTRISTNMDSLNEDGYLFAFGHDYRAAVKAFYAISGSQPLLPRWALGNWWSRYYPYRADEYLELMDRFAREKVPISVGVVDMDWHLVHDKRVTGSGWTGYTWNRTLFPDPEGFLKEMHARQMKVTLNDHPAGGVQSYEDRYEDMAEALGRDTSNGDPIAFDIADRKFCDAYFDVLLASLEGQGVDFWWVDWQQGRYTRTPGVDPLWLLNHYHYLNNKWNGKRPLAFSRFAGPGSHRYPIGFSGDTHMTWESLHFQPEFTATASNIGFGWWSHDIGGHYFGHRDEELSTRWLQLGVFSPILRLHSSDNPFIHKEPWTFSPEVHTIMTRFLRLRYCLLPYLYSMNVRSAQRLEPVVQPVYWRYPETAAAYSHKNEYFFGSELLVVPITSPSDAITRLGRVQAWLPPGRHVDILSGCVYDGGRSLTLYRPLSQFPVLARQGSIIPLDGAKLNQDGMSPALNGCAHPSSYDIIVVVGADGYFEIFEDDGTGGDLDSVKFDKIAITFTQATGEVKIEHFASASTSAPTNKPEPHLPKYSIEITLQGYAAPPNTRFAMGVETGGGAVTYKDIASDYDESMNSTIIHIPEYGFDHSPSGAELKSLHDQRPSKAYSIRLPPNPQLTPTDARKHIRAVIERAYIAHATKLRIWEIVTAKEGEMALGVKIGELSALGLDEQMLGAVMEYLVADGRSR